MNFAYTITPKGVSLVLDGRMRTVPKNSMNYEKLIAAIKSKAALDVIRNMVDIPSFIAKVTAGRVQVGMGEVRFDGEPVKNVIAERLLSLLTQGLDVEPLARFLDRLMSNPTETAREELYLFLESGDLPITDDGCFLAFKKVRSNYHDIHSGTMDNSVGKVVSMDRASVDPDRHRTCSAGLHFCSYSYLGHFGGSGGNRVVIVKIDPADVVAIPSDYNNAKGRTWRYEVVGEVPEAEAAQFFDGRPLVNDYTSTQVGVDEDGDPLPDDEGGADASEDDSFGALDEHEGEDDGNEGESAVETPELTFKHGDETFSWSAVLSGVDNQGQRGYSRLTGVPRSTIQSWMKSIEAAGYTSADLPENQ